MLEKETARYPVRRIYFAAAVCAGIASFVPLIPSLSFAESENVAFSRRYSLYGEAEAAYQRSWSQGGAVTDDFSQRLLLGNRGFVADPNLVTYDLTGTVTHDAGQGTADATVTGESLGVTLLHSLPDSWKKNDVYIPHPIWLRFSHEDGSSFESTSYGLSFMHSATRKQRFLVIEKAPKSEGEPDQKDSDLYDDGPSRTAKIVEKERLIPIPRTFFDYDHYGMQNQGGPPTTDDILSLRSTLKGDIYDYQFLFENQNRTGSVNLRKDVFQLEPNYRFYDAKTKRSINIHNFLRYEVLNQSKSTELDSNIGWSRPIGKDSLAFSGSVGYTNRSTSAGQSVATYLTAASGSYSHTLSSRLTNGTQLSANFSRTGAADSHYVRLSDSVSADLSRLFAGAVSAFGGTGTQGVEYGANAYISTKTRIQTSLTYSYSLSTSLAPVSSNLTQQTQTDLPQQTSSSLPQEFSNEKISVQTISLRAMGPLLYNLSFQANADTTLATAEVQLAGRTASEQINTVVANLFWRLPRTSITFGGNYTQLKKVDTVASETSSTSLFSTLTRTLSNRMLFNLYNSWRTTVSTGQGSSTTFEARPSLRWTRGLTSVYTEYSYSRSMGAGSTGTENRFFVRLARKFSAIF